MGSRRRLADVAPASLGCGRADRNPAIDLDALRRLLAA